MSQAFTPIARSRASYYCKGSPVHFSMVELFRMEETGETVVTLTFKNLYSRPLQRLVAHFRCKDTQGRMIGEDDFVYEDVNAAEGETFGFDDGVFVSDVPLGSVEASLVSVTYDGATHSLRGCPPVVLPRPQALSEAERRYVEGVLRIGGLKYRPAQAEDGWRCACGAFNYNAGLGKRMCTECGADKAMLAAAVHEAQRRSVPQRPMYDASMQVLPTQEASAAGANWRTPPRGV